MSARARCAGWSRAGAGWSSVRTQIKNEISAALHRNLKGRNPASDPFGKKGREWLAAQQLPLDERLTVDGCLRQLDFLGEELTAVNRIIAGLAVIDAEFGG